MPINNQFVVLQLSNSPRKFSENESKLVHIVWNMKYKKLHLKLTFLVTMWDISCCAFQETWNEIYISICITEKSTNYTSIHELERKSRKMKSIDFVLLKFRQNIGSVEWHIYTYKLEMLTSNIRIRTYKHIRVLSDTFFFKSRNRNIEKYEV